MTLPFLVSPPFFYISYAACLRSDISHFKQINCWFFSPPKESQLPKNCATKPYSSLTLEKCPQLPPPRCCGFSEDPDPLSGIVLRRWDKTHSRFGSKKTLTSPSDSALYLVRIAHARFLTAGATGEFLSPELTLCADSCLLYTSPSPRD